MNAIKLHVNCKISAANKIAAFLDTARKQAKLSPADDVTFGAGYLSAVMYIAGEIDRANSSPNCKDLLAALIGDLTEIHQSVIDGSRRPM